MYAWCSLNKAMKMQNGIERLTVLICAGVVDGASS